MAPRGRRPGIDLLTEPRLVCLSLVLTACADVGNAPEADTTAVAAPLECAGTPLSIAVSDSTVAWTATTVTGRHADGFGDVTGSVYVVDDAVTGADIAIATASLFSDDDQLTERLHSSDFFEVAVYLEATFRTAESRRRPPATRSTGRTPRTASPVC